MATITSAKVVSFIFKKITCRYGVPYKIIIHNETWFESSHFMDFFAYYGITKSFLAMVHPQANGHVKVINKILKSILKKKLRKANGNWIDKVPLALWAYRTTHKTTTGHSFFALEYGSEAMILVEVEIPSHRHKNYDPSPNEELLNTSLDTIDERRDES